jgi:hypothetical protein
MPPKNIQSLTCSWVLVTLATGRVGVLSTIIMYMCHILLYYHSIYVLCNVFEILLLSFVEVDTQIQ